MMCKACGFKAIGTSVGHAGSIFDKLQGGGGGGEGEFEDGEHIVTGLSVQHHTAAFPQVFIRSARVMFGFQFLWGAYQKANVG